ncbi:MAG: NifU family protein [Spirochaetia bacterium]|nr:NifU family protein [Spirochaetia bacterium]
MLKEQISELIQDIRPSLQADGGDIELVSVDDNGLVLVKLKGHCNGCPMAKMTLKNGVENYLRKQLANDSITVEEA